MFTGKAKQLYDCLYSLTRGSIVPSRTVRIARSELMKKSGIGAKVTLEQNLRRLVASGLVSIKTIGGIQGGNEYTVNLPEEALLNTPPSTGTSPPSPPSGGENLGLLAPLETSPPSNGLTATYERLSAAPKTSFKTKEEINDDEASAAYLTFADDLTRALAGREATRLDYISMRELFDVILTEAKIAGDRTSVVSSPAAFVAEHLRRRLFKKGKEEMEAETQRAPVQAASVEAQNCSDCHGTGWWYPNGTEKGVAKCTHLRLHTVPTGKE